MGGSIIFVVGRQTKDSSLDMVYSLTKSPDEGSGLLVYELVNNSFSQRAC